MNQLLNAIQIYNSVNNSENRIFPGETTVLSFRTIFLHILAEFKKNRWRRFFAKSQKTQKWHK
jgi:hypothetical protein